MPQASSAFSLHNYYIHNITLGIGVKITISKRKYQKNQKEGKRKRGQGPFQKKAPQKKGTRRGHKKRGISPLKKKSPTKKNKKKIWGNETGIPVASLETQLFLTPPWLWLTVSVRLELVFI
jgi:hypothetical protein